jgi:ubiquinone/menaquinone biosynthesis C-methylase UbiE
MDPPPPFIPQTVDTAPVVRASRQSPPQTNQRILYRAFQDIQAYLSDLYSIYKELYPNAPNITYEQHLQEQYSFDYCTARQYFVLIVPYTKQREVLVERSFANDQLTWVLIGGSLRHDWMETFIDAANRHAAKTITNLALGEIEPIAFLTNSFIYKSQTHTHHGIAFAARIRNPDPMSDLRAATNSRGHFVPYDDPSVSFSLTHNAAVMDLVRSYLSRVNLTSIPEEEIQENLKYQSRYVFHDATIKPLFKLFGRLHFQHSIQELEQKMTEMLLAEDHERILDVACGESSSVVGLGRLPGVNLVVGNDVSWSQVQLMNQRFTSDQFRDLKSALLFTNHDARHLPFADGYFDFVICKNVLHHMPDYESAASLIQEVVRVGRRSLVVEVMDPKFESLWGRIRHRYYMDFLHDAGEHFLSRAEFSAVTDVSERIEMLEMGTIRGVYQFATFDHEQNPTSPRKQ